MAIDAFTDLDLGIATLPAADHPGWGGRSALFSDPLDAVLKAAPLFESGDLADVLEAFAGLTAVQREQVYLGLRRAVELAAFGVCPNPGRATSTEVPQDVKVRFQRRFYNTGQQEPSFERAPVDHFVYTRQHRPGRFTVQFSS